MSEDQARPTEESVPATTEATQAALPGLEPETPAPPAEPIAPAAPEAAEEPSPEPEPPGVADDPGLRLEAVEEALVGVQEHLRTVSESLREVNRQNRGLATSIGEPRVRSVLSGLVSFFDLLDQPLRRIADGAEPAERYRDFPLLRVQLLQLFRDQGLEPIDGLGAFDPACHRAIERVPTADPALDGQLAELIRPGFRTADAALRYAEVRVYGYEPATAPDPPAAATEPRATAGEPS